MRRAHPYRRRDISYFMATYTFTLPLQLYEGAHNLFSFLTQALPIRKSETAINLFSLEAVEGITRQQFSGG